MKMPSMKKKKHRTKPPLRLMLVLSIIVVAGFQFSTFLQVSIPNTSPFETSVIPNATYTPLESSAPVSSVDFVSKSKTQEASLPRANSENGNNIYSYDPSLAPLFPRIPNTPIRVGLVTISPLIGEAMHFLYDGTMRSSCLELVRIVSLYGNNQTDQTIPTDEYQNPINPDPTDAEVWIVDGARVAKLQRDFLTRLLQAKDATWKVLVVDYSDRFSFQLRKYHKLHRLWDQPHVRLAVRSIVEGRYFDSEYGRIVRGKLALIRPTAGGPTLHSPYAVRSDLVQALPRVLGLSVGEDNASSSVSQEALAAAIFDESRERSIDVLHLWNVSFKEGKSKLRNDVSKLVRSWNGTSSQVNATVGTTTELEMITSIEEQGERRHIGRNSVSESYIRALLSAKIVIVTQKDDWEDHYRLFESVVCGALVIHDSMVAPPKGLVNGDNFLFFQDPIELESLVKYYLVKTAERKLLARSAWNFSMKRHRSWHRIEELLFGRPVTGGTSATQ